MSWSRCNLAILHCLTTALLAGIPLIADAQDDGNEPKGQMFTIRGTVDSSSVQRTLASVRDAINQGAETLIFDLQATQSEFGECYNLANSIAQVGGSVKRTVAFVSKPVSGNAVLIALACDEIVFAEKATLGDVAPQQPLKAREIQIFESLAIEQGHGSPIALGLADRSFQIIEVETPNGKTLLTDAKLAEFAKTAKILRQDIVKEAGQSWVIDAELGRRIGLVKLVRNSRKDVAAAYELPEKVASQDATFAESAKPALLLIDGIIDRRMEVSIKRRLADARNKGSNLLFIQMKSTAGDLIAASSLMAAIDRWEGQKVAWIPEVLKGPGVMLIFGCDEVVVGPDSIIGDFQTETEEEAAKLSEAAVAVAVDSKIPEAMVIGLLQRQRSIVEVRAKDNPGLRAFKTSDELEDDEEAKKWEKVREVKRKGEILTVNGGDALRSLDVATVVVDGKDKLFSTYAVEGNVPILQRTWVDGLVDGLTTPGATVFLLVVGLTCLYIEFQMPGFGIGGLLSAICFTLFFWSRFLSETANSLEVVMFLLGLIFLAIELFVLPGFGITGIAGIFLILASLILAMQSFPWPTSPSETRQLMYNTAQIFGSLFVFLGVAVLVARFFPTVPGFSRLILAPPASEFEAETFDSLDASPTWGQLLGAVGIAASPLRPAGRMKLGDEILDVVAQGEFIEAGAPIEIVEANATRIVVRSTKQLPPI